MVYHIIFVGLTRLQNAFYEEYNTELEDMVKNILHHSCRKCLCDLLVKLMLVSFHRNRRSDEVAWQLIYKLIEEESYSNTISNNQRFENSFQGFSIVSSSTTKALLATERVKTHQACIKGVTFQLSFKLSSQVLHHKFSGSSLKYPRGGCEGDYVIADYLPIHPS